MPESRFAVAPDMETFIKRYMKPSRFTATTIERHKKCVAEDGWTSLSHHDNNTGFFIHWCPGDIQALNAARGRHYRPVTQAVGG